MFDIGWTELIVVAVVMILVVGPKDLPKMLRTFGQTIGKVRRMAGEFQSTFNEALREAEQQADIADMKKQVEKAGNFDPLGDIKKSIETDRKAAKPAESAPATAKAADGTAAAAPEAGAPPTATPAPAATTAEASQPAQTDQPAKAGESGTANTAGDRTA
ncbi:Sec-independent protein translocase protein TatB [Stappia indica]|uniref:Sec-independent protein translocase protein TatB n=1 Tax=Stappia indica TaxID=538381 RepID=UPI000836D986|nr:Sec-independent protein translocase protein TatB [Stappia indica]